MELIRISETIQTDVLVIGGGGAGARAALEASGKGVEVTLAVKGKFGSIGIRGAGSTAGGVSDRGGLDYPGAPGIQGFGRKNNLTQEQDYENIIELGLGMTDRKLALIMAERSEEIMHPLVHEWSTEIFPRQWGMKSHGIPIMCALVPRVKQSGVKVLDFTIVAELLVDAGEICGAIAVNEKTGDLLLIKTHQIIMATGGEGAMFQNFVTNPCTTGDGYALAHRAGAQLMNLEFKQLFPAIIYPSVNHFSAWFFVPHVKIYNGEGNEYIENYIPEGVSLDDVYTQRSGHGPFSARDSASKYFDIATIAETKAGRANEHGALYADLTDPRVEDPLAPERKEYFYYRGIRYLEEPIQFNICFHCSNGGIRIDENGQSTVPGLYAAGEVMSGPHGANRLAGHMLGGSQVFGTIAGRHAAECAQARRRKEVSEKTVQSAVVRLESFKKEAGSTEVEELVDDLRWVAWSSFLAHSNEDVMSAAKSTIASLKVKFAETSVATPGDFVRKIELSNMLEVGEMLAGAVSMRQESRGDHYRLDYPAQNDEEWVKVILINKTGDGMKFSTEVIDPEWHKEKRTGDMRGLHWG